jgi:predicted transcriptional regulator
MPTMQPDVVGRLRAVMPRRPLGFHEALRLAEEQAWLLLELAETTHPAVPEQVISALPRIEVRRLAPFPTSGASHWSRGKWRVAINATEPTTRQRFSLAHEFKHIVDHRDLDTLYAAFPPREREQMIERVCDYFAGCLLMPRAWVMAAHAGGTRHPMDLAQVFGVSPSAMGVRLNQIGLTRPTPRCGSTRHGAVSAPTRRRPRARPRETVGAVTRINA